MTDLELLAVIYWGAVAYDGLARSPRRRHAFSVQSGGGLSGSFEKLHYLFPWPWNWRVFSADLPLYFSPDGLANQPAGGVGRPAPQQLCPRVVTWEQAADCTENKGWIYVEGIPFCPVSGFLDGKYLGRLAKRLVGQEASTRARLLQREMSSWLAQAPLRRRRLLLLARTRWLAVLNLISLVCALLLTPMAFPVEWGIPDEFWEVWVPWVPRLAIGWLGGYLLGVAGCLWAVHKLKRWLHPAATQGLWSKALFPPQAMRWRAALSECLAPRGHPLAWAAMLGLPRKSLREMGFNALTDLAWPRPSPWPAHPQVQSIRQWWVPEWSRQVTTFLRGQGIEVEELLAPPEPLHAGVCAYCPRCQDQFVENREFCPHGIPLQPLERPASVSCHGSAKT